MSTEHTAQVDRISIYLTSGFRDVQYPTCHSIESSCVTVERLTYICGCLFIVVDGKVFGPPYFLPGMIPGGGAASAAAAAASIPIVNNDIVNQQLLAAQMQMLSFYHNQMYQKKLLEDTERERIQVRI